MNTETVSFHAHRRIQQRGIPPMIVDYLEEFGSTIRNHGADHLVFDRQAQRKLRRHLGGERGMRLVEPWLGVYAVIAHDGCVITVAHAHKRHRRH